MVASSHRGQLKSNFERTKDLLLPLQLRLSLLKKQTKKPVAGTGIIDSMLRVNVAESNASVTKIQYILLHTYQIDISTTNMDPCIHVKTHINISPYH
jgi:hypothetical protein